MGGLSCVTLFLFLYLFLTNQNLCQPCLKMLWRIVVRTQLEISSLRRDSWEKRFSEPPDSGGSVFFFGNVLFFPVFQPLETCMSSSCVFANQTRHFGVVIFYVDLIFTWVWFPSRLCRPVSCSEL